MAVAADIKYQNYDRVHCKNDTGSTLPVRSIVVIGDRIGVTNAELADGEVGIAHIARVWTMPVNSTLNATVAAGDVLYWDAADGELNDDSVNNPRAGIVVSDAAGDLCNVADHQYVMINA